MRQYKPLPHMSLAPTLAQRLSQLRELRNLTCRDLAKYSRLPLKRIEDIECGIETWLSSVDRQLIAKALAVEPYVLQEVEVRSKAVTDDATMQKICDQLSEDILSGIRDLECPVCHNPLRCSVQDAFDLEGNKTYFAQAFCLKCPFVLK